MPLQDPDIEHYVDELALLFKNKGVNRLLNESIVKNIGSTTSSILNRSNSPRYNFLDHSME